MKNLNSINAHLFPRPLFLIATFCLLAITACSSLEAAAGQKFHAALIGKTETHAAEDEDPVAANRNWYQAIE